jgi:hypothetical protein
MRRPELLGQLRPVGPSRERNKTANQFRNKKHSRVWMGLGELELTP